MPKLTNVATDTTCPMIHDDASEPIRIENWSIFKDGPESRLKGEVYNHPLFADGDDIITSGVQRYHPELGVARTRNTLYWLGQRRSY